MPIQPSLGIHTRLATWIRSKTTGTIFIILPILRASKTGSMCKGPALAFVRASTPPNRPRSKAQGIFLLLAVVSIHFSLNLPPLGRSQQQDDASRERHTLLRACGFWKRADGLIHFDASRRPGFFPSAMIREFGIEVFFNKPLSLVRYFFSCSQSFKTSQYVAQKE